MHTGIHVCSCPQLNGRYSDLSLFTPREYWWILLLKITSACTIIKWFTVISSTWNYYIYYVGLYGTWLLQLDGGPFSTTRQWKVLCLHSQLTNSVKFLKWTCSFYRQLSNYLQKVTRKRRELKKLFQIFILFTTLSLNFFNQRIFVDISIFYHMRLEPLLWKFISQWNVCGWILFSLRLFLSPVSN